MKKENLKTGMQIHFKDGVYCTVLLNTYNGDIAGGGTWFPLREKPSLLSDWDCYGGVDFISQPRDNYQYISEFIDDKIWENKPVEEMTLSQVCKELGKTIKIIEG